MSRGDRREDIFLDDVDRQDFLKTLAEACQKADWQVHASTPAYRRGRRFRGAVPAIGNEPGRGTLPVVSAVLARAQDIALFLAFLA